MGHGVFFVSTRRIITCKGNRNGATRIQRRMTLGGHNKYVKWPPNMGWSGMGWSGMEWNGFQWSMIILKRAGRPGQLFSVKWTFLWSRSSKKKSNDEDTDQQDVSSLAFFAKHRSVNRLLKFRIFFRSDDFCRFWLFGQQSKTNDYFDAPQAYQLSVPD